MRRSHPLSAAAAVLGASVLSAQQPDAEQQLIARAKAIHERVITLDTHDDINAANFTPGCNYTQRLTTQVNIPKMTDGGGGVEGWSHAGESANVTVELVRRGYTEEQIGKLWSGNLLRVWEQVEKAAGK